MILFNLDEGGMKPEVVQDMFRDSNVCSPQSLLEHCRRGLGQDEQVTQLS